MLVVMAIASILLVIAVVAGRGVGSTSARHAAVGNLMGVLDQARMVAISDGRPTYVVFASSPGGQTTDNTTLTPSMWGRAYALYEDPVLQDTSSAATFQPQQRSAWLYLPTGVAFKCSSSDGTPLSLTSTSQGQRDQGDTTKFSVVSRSSGGTAVALTLPYVKFNAAGEIIDYKGDLVDAISPALRVLLFEGSANNQGAEMVIRRAGSSSDDKKFALDEILLKPTTGRARYTLDAFDNLSQATYASN